jgi:heterodisulfide reductase subunit A
LVNDPKVAIFICDCNDKIGTNIDLDELEKAANTNNNVVVVKRNKSLCTKDGQEFMKTEIKNAEADHVVVAACTPRTYEEIIKNAAKDAGINKNLYEQTGIREQCEWVHQKKELATTKAICLLNCALGKVALAQKIEDEDIEIKNNAVLVIGGGVAGMQAAIGLAQHGVRSYLVERNSELGGTAIKLSSAVLDELKDVIPKSDQVMNNDKIEVLLDTEITDIQGFFGNYQVKVQPTKTETSEDQDESSDRILEMGGIIVATGSKIFDPNRIPELRYENDNVITSFELENILDSNEIKRPSDGAAPKTVNFIQCVGSRDETKGNPHCSLVCCTYAIRQAIRIKELNPEISVYVHYMDLRGPYSGFEELYREAQTKGVQFLRGRISEVQNNDGKLVLRAENVDLGEPFEWDSDLIILSVGQEANEGTDKLSELLHIPKDIDGFLGEYNYHWDILDRRGISIAGGAQGPRNIIHALRDANKSVNELTELFANGSKIKEAHSVIDPDRCSGCGICESLCPYEAISMIEIEDYETEEVKQISNVDVSTCQACGACVMSCPSNVPVLSHFTADQLFAEIDAVT